MFARMRDPSTPGPLVSQDIQAEAALPVDALQLFHDLPFIGMAITSPTSKRWRHANQVLCDMLGYTREELVTRTWADVTHPDDLAADVVLFESVLQGERDGYVLEKRFVARDGRVVHTTLDVKAIRGAGGAVEFLVATVADITARKEAEARALASTGLLHNLVQQVPGVVYQYQLYPDHRTRFPYASPGIREIFEVEPEDVLHDATFLFDRVHPDDLPVLWESIVDSAQTLEPWRCRFRYQLPIRGERWLHGDARPERLADGSTLWHGYISDVTEEEGARAALLRLEAAIASSHAGVAIADLEGRLSYVNLAFLELWGYSDTADVLGRPAVSFWSSPEAAQAVVEALRRTGAWTGELVATRPDGSERVMLVQASSFADRTGKPAGMLASFVDVSEERRLRAQLLQSQKLESVGRLAGGVAHDFNNLLTVMKGYLELALQELPPGHAGVAHLHEVDRAADSAASLTQQLLAFSRKQIIAPRVLDLNDVVRRVHAMLQRLLGEHVALEFVTAADLWPVRFDPGQAEQILVNLAVNARDAMPQGGRLTIETANVRLDAAYVADHPDVEPGEYVLLGVSDTGVGMSSEIREHAFEPFYTTKQPGHGTGLGLAMIHGAVSQNGGRVEVYSEPGHGTSFKIYLPRADAERDASPARVVHAAPRGKETILVVEDDERLRVLTVRLLRQFGYQAVAVGGGEEALAWLAEHPAPIDLLLTDVIMPGMNGKVLADEVRRLRPGTRVLFTSGYTANVIVHHGVLQAGVEFLAKPFGSASLAQRVREVLDAAPPSPDAS